MGIYLYPFLSKILSENLLFFASLTLMLSLRAQCERDLRVTKIEVRNSKVRKRPFYKKKKKKIRSALPLRRLNSFAHSPSLFSSLASYPLRHCHCRTNWNRTRSSSHCWTNCSRCWTSPKKTRRRRNHCIMNSKILILGSETFIRWGGGEGVKLFTDDIFK